MEVQINPSWKAQLESEFSKEYFQKLVAFVREEYQKKTVYPPPKNIFRAFELCPWDSLKVVIIGQDPYHGKGQANGLCFSVNGDVAIPPSLQNIYKEIEADLGKAVKQTGNLENWARQGVLLLNATLTVVAGQAGSHQKKGWEQFTDAVISHISEKKEHIVFMLWGRYAQEKANLIDEKRHFILTAAHPSPFSAYNGWFGSKHFSKANEYMEFLGERPIEW